MKMSTRHKTRLVIMFTAMTSIFAFQCPPNKECQCKLLGDDNFERANITCTMDNNSVFNIILSSVTSTELTNQQNNVIQIRCINSSNLSDFKYMPLGLTTCDSISFYNCNLPNNQIKLMDIMQKLGVIEKSFKELSFIRAKNLTFKKHHLNGFEILKILIIGQNNVTYMDKDLLADLKELNYLALTANNLQHLDAEFFDYTPKLNWLHLGYNNLKLIKPSTFDKLQNLKTLHLVNNHLIELQLGIFNKLVALEKLDVSSNNLVSLPKDIFAKLKNLVILYLQNNSFIDLPRDLLRNNTKLSYVALNYNQKNLILLNGFFSNLTNLEKLELNNDGLVTLPEDLFWGSFSLKEIYLNDNYLQSLHVNIFRDLTELRELRLNSNNLEDLPDNIFLRTNQLRILDLSNNRITAISEQLFNKLYWLKELHMKKNHLKTISGDSFRSLKKLEIVNLSNNHLEVLSDNIFSDTWQLKTLDLSNNRITAISEYLFNKLYSLQKLNITKNYLKTISKGSFKSLEKLKTVYLSNNHIEVLPDNIFSDTQQLRTLDLSNNRITAISITLFNELYLLEELNMEQNHLKTISFLNFENLENLKIIKLSNNNLTLQSNEWISPLTNCPLKELYLANNSISKIFDWITKFHDLHILDLSYNNISSIKTEDLLFSSYNITVNLTYNKIQHITLHKYDIKEETKTYHNIKILMKHNPLNCDCDILYDLLRYKEGEMDNIKSHFQIEIDPINSICHSFPKELEKLRNDLNSKNLICRVRNTDSITVCPEKCDCFLKLHDKAFIFDCSNKNLTSVPSDIKKLDIFPIQTFTKSIDSISQFELNFSHNWLMHMPNLKTMELGMEQSIKELILSHNNISEISSDGLSTTIKVLELHNNNLSRIHPKELRILKKINLTRLTLHENPWECDCDATELLNFTKIKSQILAEISKIMCHREKKSILEMTFNDFCPLNTTMIFSISTAIALIGLITGSFGILYYKYQTHIKIWLFAHQWCLWFVTEEELDKDKLYDAFVSFSHKDNDFIVDELVPKLESGPTPFKLCLHYRDWLAGEWISENIVRSIENSRRTIVVLSPYFLESVWGRMEFRAAHCQALSDGRARVILILYGNIESTDNLDPELKAYMSMNTYIQWGDPWFWDKLRYALPHQSRRPTCSSARREVLENHERIRR